MNAQHIPIKDFSSFEEWEVLINDKACLEQEEIVLRSLAKLPLDLPPKDKLLFGVMLANIMDAPVPQESRISLNEQI